MKNKVSLSRKYNFADIKDIRLFKSRMKMIGTMAKRNPEEALKYLKNMKFNVTVDKGSSINSVLQTLKYTQMLMIQTKLDIVAEYILPPMIKQYIWFIVLNQQKVLSEWAGYKALSPETLIYAKKYSEFPKNDRFFYVITGDLIQNGIIPVYTKGDNLGEGTFEITTSEKRYRDRVTSDGVQITYARIFSMLDKGVAPNPKKGVRGIPARPFFSVIKPKVDKFVSDYLKDFFK